jgi:putative Mn2+ efflux pump MntP
VNLSSLIGIAIGLSMDAFAVSLAAGLTLGKVTPRHTFRLTFHLGLLQFLMPILGWLAGREIASEIREYDHWLAFALLGFVGAKMLYDGWRGESAETRSDPTRGLMLVTLSLATSIDALAVGLSMALLDVSVWFPAIVIGAVAAGLTAIGISFGQLIGSRVGRWAEVAGGCVLIFIGIRIVITHLSA